MHCGPLSEIVEKINMGSLGGGDGEDEVPSVSCVRAVTKGYLTT